MRHFILICFVLFLAKAQAGETRLYYWDSCVTQEIKVINYSGDDGRPFPLLKHLKQKQINARKLTAAILAFPFPFGIVGLHRIYLGTKPYVPVVYIATLGGVFGVLPLIDFFAIIFDKDFDSYNENGKVLMWVK